MLFITSEIYRRIAIKENWAPKSGDIIISNWISWLELALLAFRYYTALFLRQHIHMTITIRFNPIFVLPVTSTVDHTEAAVMSPTRVTPGRRTGTGSAAISMPKQNRTPTKRANILGFNEVSLLSMISSCGHIPPFGDQAADVTYKSLGQIQARAEKAGRPLAIFPECTTSNGRGLLRFAAFFEGIQVPVKNFKVFIMCVR